MFKFQCEFHECGILMKTETRQKTGLYIGKLLLLSLACHILDKFVLSVSLNYCQSTASPASLS